MVGLSGAARRGSRAALAGLSVVSLAACSSPAGLGRKACLYLRPRLVRLDNDRAAITNGEAAGAVDLPGVATDIHLYVLALPDGGKAPADRNLVAFSAALDAVAAPPGPAEATPGATAELDRTEGLIHRLCAVAP